MNGVTPFDVCCCATCGPPWRDERPEPDRDAEFGAWLGWHSWMALCPTCGNKRCPGAANHTNVCTGSNATGQPGSLYADMQPRVEVGPNGKVRVRASASTTPEESK